MRKKCTALSGYPVDHSNLLSESSTFHSSNAGESHFPLFRSPKLGKKQFPTCKPSVSLKQITVISQVSLNVIILVSLSFLKEFNL